MNELKEYLRFRMQHESYFNIHYKQNGYFEKLMFLNFYYNRISITHYLEKDFYLFKIYDRDNKLLIKDTCKSISDLNMYLESYLLRFKGD